MPTVIYQGAEPTITAIQVRKEKEAELRANDDYWSKRLQAQEADFLKNSKIMEKEFQETVSTLFLGQVGVEIYGVFKNSGNYVEDF